MKQTLKAVLLALILTLSAGCEQKDYGYCPHPVRASEEVKWWYKSHGPLTPAVREYLKAIGDQQQAIEDNCR